MWDDEYFYRGWISIPVSVVHVEANTIVQIKTIETDGYRAIQVTTGYKKRSRLSKPLAGHYAKSSVEAGRGFMGICYRVRMKRELFCRF